jgi:hypothetical protein
MARSFLQLPIFPFWHWLKYGRFFLAGAWIVCLSIAYGRHARSATEYDDELRRPPKLFQNPFVNTPADFSPEELVRRRENWRRVSQIPQPTHADETERNRLIERWKVERSEPQRLAVPGNFPENGNYGHNQVDFGAQWLMGRMIVRGYGKDLYDRNRHRQVLNESFLLENEPLDHQLHNFPKELRPTHLQNEDLKSDAVWLIDWTVGSGNDSPRWPELATQVSLAFAGGSQPFAYGAELQLAVDTAKPNLAEDLSKPSIGGPLYPPVHALLYAPLGLIEDPRIAYYVFQLISTLSIFVAGFSVRLMTYGRIWTPIACMFLLLYPGFQPGLTLGQNHVVSLAIVMVGWAMACRGKFYWGGLIWGLLAFKPVWAVVFGLVPLLMWRPRFLFGMATTGFALCAATLPMVGIHGWQNWLANGSEATKVYNRNSNWINLSRDLSGIVRRLMLDFQANEMDRNVLTNHIQLPKIGPFGGKILSFSDADLVSWIVLFAVFATTVVVYSVWGRPRKLLGLSAGFLFLGFYLCCFRFMYYDALLSALGVAALLAYPKWFLRREEWKMTEVANPTARRGTAFINSFPLFICGLLLLLHTYFLQLRPNMIHFGDHQDNAPHGVKVRFTAGLIYDYATDTLLVIALWLWAGWRMILGGNRPEDETIT